MLIEFDLTGAEWVICAYLSGDKNMLSTVEEGRDPHIATGSLISGASETFVEAEHQLVGSQTDPDIIRSYRSKLDVPRGVFLPRSMSIRQAGKKSNHGLNYGMGHRRFALENEMLETEAKPIVEAYSTVAYPGIQEYWKSVRDELRADRTLTNCFGRKVRLLGEWGQELWRDAYAFKPQSTVFDVCRTGMVAAYEDQSAAFKPAQLAAQIHDSVLYDYMSDNLDGLAEFCWKMKCVHMRPLLRIKDPKGQEREFQLGVDVKIGRNWGSMRSVKSPEDLRSVALTLPC
jgi:DNA polymerase I-like protein with 3'-5' exonuclease and polymerase domains